MIYNIFLDIDGVFADFEKGVEKYFPGAFDGRDHIPSEELWPMVETKVKPAAMIFGELDILPDAFTLWNHVKKYNPKFLSATGRADLRIGREQKTTWVHKTFNTNVDVIVVERSRHKALYATPTSILIDDSDSSIIPWRQAGGIGIKHTDARSTIRILDRYINNLKIA